MKKLLISCLLFVSCGHTMPEKSELAVVSGKSYVPYDSQIGTGISSSGSLVVTSSSSPEKYMVVFNCLGHGHTFALEGKEMFVDLKEGDTVRLYYNDIVNSDTTRLLDVHTRSYEIVNKR